MESTPQWSGPLLQVATLALGGQVFRLGRVRQSCFHFRGYRDGVELALDAGHWFVQGVLVEGHWHVGFPPQLCHGASVRKK